MSRAYSGKLIVIEGIDGVGKSSQCQLIADYLVRKGYTVNLLKEPSDGSYGKEIRKLAQEGRHSDPEDEYKLFILDRKDNVVNNILPSLNKGEIVVLDRYYFSTIAYQGALGLAPERIRKENEAFAPIPDLVLIMELSVDEAISRITEHRKEQTNLFETKDYLTQVKSFFDGFKEPYIVRIDSAKSKSLVQEQIIKAIEQRLLN